MGVRSGGVGQGGCVQRFEVIVKMQKKVSGMGGAPIGGVRVDVYKELKLL